MILSGVVMNEEQRPCTFVHYNHNISEIHSLKSNIEEADHRLIPHIQWSLQEGHKNFAVISNDTDVLVLLLHYCKIFLRMGLQKMWIRVGKGDKKRFIPVHTLYNRLGPLRKVLLATHIGTGFDYLSKIGTKLGALNAIPEKILIDFARGQSLDERQIEAGEKYLVNVLKINASETTFDELRCSQYSNNDSIFDLPATSHSIVKGHIPRWFYILKKLSNLLNPEFEPFDPVDYGWKIENEELLP